MADHIPDHCEFLADPMPADIAALATDPASEIKSQIAEIAARVHRFYHRDRTTAATWETCRFRLCRDLQRLHEGTEKLAPHHG